MKKITKFRDIPQFTSDGCYQVNYPIISLVRYIEEEVETMGLQLNPEFQRGHVWTEEQQIAYEKVKDKIENNEYKSFLLYGVTGSRKNRSIFATYRKSNKK